MDRFDVCLATQVKKVFCDLKKNLSLAGQALLQIFMVKMDGFLSF